MKAVWAVLSRGEASLALGFAVLAAAYLQIPQHGLYTVAAVLYVLVAAMWLRLAIQRRNNRWSTKVKGSPRLKVMTTDTNGEPDQVVLSTTLAQLETWLYVKDPLRSNRRHSLMSWWLALLPHQDERERRVLEVTINHED